MNKTKKAVKLRSSLKYLTVLFLCTAMLVACGKKQDKQNVAPPQLQIPDNDDTFSSALVLPPRRPSRGEVTPPAVKLLDLKPEEPAKKVVIFSNVGQIPLKIKGMRSSGNDDKISIDGSCKSGLEIAPGQGCDVTVSFIGGDVGRAKGEVIIFHDGENAPSFIPIEIEVVDGSERVEAPAEPEPESEESFEKKLAAKRQAEAMRKKKEAAKQQAIQKKKAAARRIAQEKKAVEERLAATRTETTSETKRTVRRVRQRREEAPRGSIADPYLGAASAIATQRSAAGIKVFMSRDALEAERGPGVVKANMQDKEWNRGDLLSGDGMFPKTTSTFPVDRTRIITSDRHIPAVLETSINSSLSGRVISIIERNVYGANGRKALIPAGSRVVGSAASSAGSGNPRMDIAWNRIILPNGATIAIDFNSADTMGQLGVVGHVEQQYFERYGVPLLLTALTGFGQIALSSATGGVSVVGENVVESTSSPRQQAVDELAQNVLSTINQVIEDRTEIQPIVIIPAGTRLYIVPTRDIFLRDPETFVAMPSKKDRDTKNLNVERAFRGNPGFPARHGLAATENGESAQSLYSRTEKFSSSSSSSRTNRGEHERRVPYYPSSLQGADKPQPGMSPRLSAPPR
ncbi:MAG: TrbI/VirB10 family protein [Alphaproteobacteria bacterium]